MFCLGTSQSRVCGISGKSSGDAREVVGHRGPGWCNEDLEIVL